MNESLLDRRAVCHRVVCVVVHAVWVRLAFGESDVSREVRSVGCILLWWIGCRIKISCQLVIYAIEVAWQSSMVSSF